MIMTKGSRHLESDTRAQTSVRTWAVLAVLSLCAFWAPDAVAQ